MKVIKFKNAFGIKNLSIQGGEFSKHTVVYAPNGWFKSSFTRAIELWSSREKKIVIEDRFTNEAFEAIVEFNGKRISNTDVLSPAITYMSDEENDDPTEYVKFLIMDTIDRKKLEEIELKSAQYIEKIDLILKDKKLDRSKVGAVINIKNDLDFAINFYEGMERNNYIENLGSVVQISKLNQKAYEKFDDREVKKDIESYQKLVNEQLDSLLYDNSFTDVKGAVFLKALKESDFLNEVKNRGIILNKNEYYEVDLIESKFEEMRSEVMKDPEVQMGFKRIEDAFKSVEGKKIINGLKDNKDVLLKMPIGRDNILFSLLNDIEKTTYKDEILELKELKKNKKDIYAKAASTKSLFDKALEKYISIFKPTFEITIDERENVLEGMKRLELIFTHNKDISKKKYGYSDIKTILSSGERTALKVLSFIVKYEQIKNNTKSNEKILIVLDDIVETFDYQHRAGFLEYLHNLVLEDRTLLIVLTHNFEFYRRVKTSFTETFDYALAEKTQTKIILQKNNNAIISLKSLLNKVNSLYELIYKIPFFREVADMNKNDSLKELLTKCLHWKKETGAIKIADIVVELNSLGVNTEAIDMEKHKTYIDVIDEIVDRISGINYYDVKAKIILAISSRIIIEKKVIGDDFSLIEDCNLNQTRFLYNKLKDELEPNRLKALEKVLLYTPDYIHVNSFMYEPLVDIDPQILIELYKEIKRI